MANAHRKRNFLVEIKINEIRLSEDNEIKDRVARLLNSLGLSTIGRWKVWNDFF